MFALRNKRVENVVAERSRSTQIETERILSEKDALNALESAEHLESDKRGSARLFVERCRRSPWLVPSLLYVATWFSTTFVGYFFYSDGSLFQALCFSFPLMTILTCHELGHYLQNLRYGLRSTPPYFIPLPFPPLGTFGAIISIKGRLPTLRSLFDVGVSGPLAGLVATLFFLVVGLLNSTLVPIESLPEESKGLVFGEPLIMVWTARALLGYDPSQHILMMHPTCLAAWVGILLTTINLFPIGQLDGGHVFYALTRRYARICSYVLYGGAVVGTVCFQCWNWSLFLVALFFLGIRHPSVLSEEEPLGVGRAILGWCALAFIILGFTLHPIS